VAPELLVDGLSLLAHRQMSVFLAPSSSLSCWEISNARSVVLTSEHTDDIAAVLFACQSHFWRGLSRGVMESKMFRSNHSGLHALVLIAITFGGCGGKGASDSISEQGSRGGAPAAAVTNPTKGGQPIATGGTGVTIGGGSALGGTSSQEPLDAGAPLGGASGASSSSPSSFPDYLSGLWIMGWSGGLEHYSWVRFSPYDVTSGGRLELLDSPDSGAWDPFFPCEGTGRWYLTAMPQTIELRLPTACGQDATFVFVIKSVGPASGYGLFSKASQQATLQSKSSISTGGNPINAFKYPDAQCDAAMTTCMAPE